MKALVSPRTVLPFVCGAGLVMILLSYANVGQVLRTAGRFQPIYLLLLLGLAVGYQALRAAQWFLMLRVADRRLPWRAAVMSYMGGEMAKCLPVGQYFQTYLLSRAQGTPIARSAAATTIILWLEVVVCLLIVTALGVGSWTWARPAAIGLLCGIAVVVMLVKGRGGATQSATDEHRSGKLHAARMWVDGFAASAAMLLRPGAIGPAAVLSFGYICCAAATLWTIGAALGLRSLGLEHAVAIYAFALAASLIIPIPIDLGLTEVSGLAALLVFGVPRAEAVALMLLHRMLSGLLTAAVALPALALLRQHVLVALRGQTWVRRRKTHTVSSFSALEEGGCCL